ncbi:Mobile element protein [Richelia intracellularis]|nr:Mobile element protein [Richelia intracellularis]
MTKNYPSNLTWKQWELIAEMFPEAKPGGRPRRTTCMYAVVKGI